MSVSIKLGTGQEIDLAHGLMRAAFEEYRYLDVPSSALIEPIDQLKEAYQNGKEQFILCSLDEQVVGSSRFQLKEEGLYFSRLSVTPKARGKGLAKAMLLWLEDYAKNLGKTKIECRVRLSLPKNILLYKSLGYQVILEERVISASGREVMTVVMVKEI
ncbi:GNAT family N-acetyltransferase [Pullulanibacillus sp. KACC 23026]|uniref:GNAT family N-acetyltransferase n=1 Tax=Pullulanibacillus sp. KACC 23026 TaxID=3028315 RepID=UPI0023AFF626|nr:GNAT family N-acetyltransferase [Pullulanibacillus sp. KACC 23026]WEG14428.1 GNAT family N-acetyltransferase [Pullulanibacillus sp. KACC 23026]